MPRIVPNGDNTTPSKHPRTLERNKSSSRWHRLERKWNDIQVGRQGSYSVERLESLDHYCKTTSLTRVVLVCFLTPIPALATASLLECLPLQSPSKGWAPNWMFWIRFCLMVFTLVFVGISAFNQFVPNFGLTVRKRFVVAIGTTIGYAGTCVLVAATKLIGFPLPFMWQGGGILIAIYTPMMFVFIFGMEPFAENSPFRPHLRRYLRMVMAYISLGAVFPLYKLLYQHVPETYKAGALIVLPVWKFTAKHFMMWASRELEDFVPIIVALTVDFFSALFVSACISSSNSIGLSTLFIVTDVAQIVLELREVGINAKTRLELLESRHEFTDSTKHENGNTSTTEDMIARLVVVTRNPSAFGVVSLKHTRLWACLPHPMPQGQEDRLNVLDVSGIYGPKGLLSKKQKKKSNRHRRSLGIGSMKATSIVPTSRGRLEFESSIRRTMDDKSIEGEKFRDLIVQRLELLFHCEYLALVEYVECVIPLVFATNKLVLKQLPNAVYYPGGAGKWGMSAITNIFVFATMEIGSLLFLNYSLQRKFAFSPLHQLAFALETSMNFVQSVLFLEIVGLLQYELAHLGADFTFRFEWLHD